MTLTKSNIVDQVQNRLTPEKFSKREAAKIVDTLIEILRRSLECGDDVLVTGFGKFAVKDKAERKGRNPATGNEMMLARRRVVTFKSSGILRKMVDDPPKPKRGRKKK